MKKQTIGKTQGQKGFATAVVVIIAVIVIAGLAIGYGYRHKPSDTTVSPSPSQTTTILPTPTLVVLHRPTPTPTPTATPAPWNNFVDTKYNFSFKYPGDWHVNVINSENAIFYQTAGDLKNSVYLGVEDNPNQLNLQQWLQLKGFTGSFAFEPFPATGGSMVRVPQLGSNSSVHVFFQLNDHVVHFLVDQRTDYLAIFNTMVSSMKLGK